MLAPFRCTKLVTFKYLLLKFSFVSLSKFSFELMLEICNMVMMKQLNFM